MADSQKTPENEYRAAIIEDIRPWGKFRRYPHESAGSIKIIAVNPGGILSLQQHQKRSEYWIVLDDGLEITLGDQVLKPKANAEIYIARGTPHRLRNPGNRAARIMEIWLGESDEGDITRIEDEYGRS
jgi:mannose-6-phosphate isomerase-like protein (cupin superfamily)